jgi:hypothetical protein
MFAWGAMEFEFEFAAAGFVPRYFLLLCLRLRNRVSAKPESTCFLVGFLEMSLAAKP